MPNPPSGTVAFLFTDIEASTRNWEEHSQAMGAALRRHDTLLGQAIDARGGHVFKTVGDAFCATFRTAPEALAAALDAQRALLSGDQSSVLRVRMAIHVGAAEERDGDYFGPPVNRVARLMSAGHGGQVLLSSPAYDLVRDSLPEGVDLVDLGEHRLKDLTRPEHVYQAVAPGLPAEFPPLKTLDSRPHNLPFERSPLVGREKEIAAIEALLLRQDVGLLTLTGPGGTGKTRLALQVAAEMLDRFEDGAFFVNLAPIVDPALVPSTIAQALGVREVGGQPLVDTLKAYLKEKQLLLVLDNFEQVADAAPVAGELLGAAPRLKIMATSRVPLRVRGERERPVPPLSLPDTRHLPPLEKLTQYEAVKLFIERAQAVKPGFEVNNQNAPAVAEICARLDGLPLAIELAAARIRLLPPQAMLPRLHDRLKLLTGGARDLPTRQQTLRNAIEWSYDLLTEGEKQLFRRLAVFQGGCTLEAAEAVCGGEGVGDQGSGAGDAQPLEPLQVDVLDGVESLVSKSLLQQREGVDGEPRFVMLETIHEFAREKLEESGEEKAVQWGHASYFMSLAERAEPGIRGHGQAEWLDRMEEEHDNIREALNWIRARSTGATIGEWEKSQPVDRPIDIGLRLVADLHRFWMYRGHYTEGRKQIRSLLDISASSEPTPARRAARGWALLGEAILTNRQGDTSQAQTLSEEALAIFREQGDKNGIASALLNVVPPIPDPEKRRALLDESRAHFEEAGDSWNLARVHYQFGAAADWAGDFALSRRHLEASLALAEQAGDAAMTVLLVIDLGNNASSRGDYDSALLYFERSLAMSSQLRDKWGMATALLKLSDLGVLQGNADDIRPLAEQALLLGREMGIPQLMIAAMLALAHLALAQDDTDQARKLLEECLRVAQNTEQDSYLEVWALRLLGHVARREGDAKKAKELYRRGLPVSPHETMPDELVRRVAAAGLAALGGLETDEGAARTPERAARLLGAAEAVIERSGWPLYYDERIEYERSVDLARARMSDDTAWERAWNEGRAMTTDQAIAYALEENE